MSFWRIGLLCVTGICGTSLVWLLALQVTDDAEINTRLVQLSYTVALSVFTGTSGVAALVLWFIESTRREVRQLGVRIEDKLDNEEEATLVRSLKEPHRHGHRLHSAQ